MDVNAHGSWTIPALKDAEVTLRSGKVGIMSAEATAPVRSGSLVIDAAGVHFELVIALEKLRMGNFLLQAAARTLVNVHKVHDLSYSGTGADLDSVSGIAIAGDVEVPLDLRLIITGSQLEFIGSANMGTVEIPLPGMGRIEDFSFDADAKMSLQPAS